MILRFFFARAIFTPPRIVLSPNHSESSIWSIESWNCPFILSCSPSTIWVGSRATPLRFYGIIASFPKKLSICSVSFVPSIHIFGSIASGSSTFKAYMFLLVFKHLCFSASHCAVVRDWWLVSVSVSHRLSFSLVRAWYFSFDSVSACFSQLLGCSVSLWQWLYFSASRLCFVMKKMSKWWC